MPKVDEMETRKPANYPLPWCEALDCPYWQINFGLCLSKEGWAVWQKPLAMKDIIPRIDELIAAEGATNVR